MSTSAVIAEMIADVEEFVDSTDGLDALLSELRTLGEGDAPAPDRELLALLAGSTSPATVAALRAASRPSSPGARRRNAIAGLAAATVAGLSITGAAAAANELPASIQRVVAHFSENYLPFSFPRPVGDPPASGAVGSEGSGASGAGDPGTAGTSGHVRARSGTKGQHGTDVTGPVQSPGSAAPQETGASGTAQGGDTGNAAGNDTGNDTGKGTDHSQDHGDNGQGSQGSGQGSGSGTGSGGSTPPTGAHHSNGHAYAGQGNAGKGVPPTAPPGQVDKPAASGSSTSGSSGRGTSGQSAPSADTSSGAGETAAADGAPTGGTKGKTSGKAQGTARGTAQGSSGTSAR